MRLELTDKVREHVEGLLKKDPLHANAFGLEVSDVVAGCVAVKVVILDNDGNALIASSPIVMKSGDRLAMFNIDAAFRIVMENE